jgi:hypothetical protein
MSNNVTRTRYEGDQVNFNQRTVSWDGTRVFSTSLLHGDLLVDKHPMEPMIPNIHTDGQLEVELDMLGHKNLTVDEDGYFGGTLDGDPTGRLLSRIELADQRPKPFDMVHPSLGEGYRLRYACIEGPEVGVYFRGRVKDNTEIDLPSYWKDLVHTDSISVQLQPIGSFQNVIIKSWDSEKVYLESENNQVIDCFYHIYAERKDVNALVVEYEGNDWKDYPDKNYDDPNYSNKINTKTT